MAHSRIMNIPKCTPQKYDFFAVCILVYKRVHADIVNMRAHW